jgi:hypothetical protein
MEVCFLSLREFLKQKIFKKEIYIYRAGPYCCKVIRAEFWFLKCKKHIRVVSE